MTGPHQPYGAQPPPSFGPPAGYPPQPETRSKLPWILGGIGALALVVVLVVVVVFVTRDKGQHYSADGITDACELLDLSALDKWEATHGKREHKEERNILGTVLNCDATNESDEVARLASFNMIATVAKSESEAKSGFEMSERFMDNSSQTTSRGDVFDLGQKAHFTWEKHEFRSKALLNRGSIYHLDVLDGNLEIVMVVHLAAEYDEADVASVAAAQVRRAMSRLQK